MPERLRLLFCTNWSSVRLIPSSPPPLLLGNLRPKDSSPSVGWDPLEHHPSGVVVWSLERFSLLASPGLTCYQSPIIIIVIISAAVSSSSSFIMSCGNGCGCCPKCGCRATCTCNQSMYFDEVMDDTFISYSVTTGSEDEWAPDCGCPAGSGVNKGWVSGWCSEGADNAGDGSA